MVASTGNDEDDVHNSNKSNNNSRDSDDVTYVAELMLSK